MSITPHSAHFLQNGHLPLSAVPNIFALVMLDVEEKKNLKNPVCKKLVSANEILHQLCKGLARFKKQEGKKINFLTEAKKKKKVS